MVPGCGPAAGVTEISEVAPLVATADAGVDVAAVMVAAEAEEEECVPRTPACRAPSPIRATTTTAHNPFVHTFRFATIRSPSAKPPAGTPVGASNVKKPLGTVYALPSSRSDATEGYPAVFRRNPFAPGWIGPRPAVGSFETGSRSPCDWHIPPETRESNS